MNYTSALSFNDSAISAWSHQTSSIINSDCYIEHMREPGCSDNKRMRYCPPELLSLLNDNSIDTIIQMPTATDKLFDVFGFLQTLMEDIEKLKEQIKQKTTGAMKESMEQTLAVLTIHNMVMKMRMEVTVKELQNVVNETFETEECVPMRTNTVKSLVEKHESSGAQEYQVNSSWTNSYAPSVAEKIIILDLYRTDQMEPLFIDQPLTQYDNSEQISKLTGQSWLIDELVPIKWLRNLQRQLYDETLTFKQTTNIGSKKNIETILILMQTFNDTEKIEYVSLEILRDLIDNSYNTRLNIIKSGLLEHLERLYTSYWPLRLPLSDPEFSNLVVYSGHVFANLLSVDDCDWKVTKTKNEIEEAFLCNIVKWPVGGIELWVFLDMNQMTESVQNGTRWQKCFCTVIMLNQLMQKTSQYCQLLEEIKDIPKGKSTMNDPTTDTEIKELLRSSIDIYSKYALESPTCRDNR